MRKLLALLFAALFVVSAAAPLAAAQSQSNWLSLVSVFDITGNASQQASQPLLTGHAYNITMQVTVPFSQGSSQFSLNISPFLQQQGSQYWYVKTPSYAGYNSSTAQLGSKGISFKQVQGSFVVSAIFAVPLSLTLQTFANQTFGNFTRHFAYANFTYVTATVLPSSPVGYLGVTVEDQTIQTYLATYAEKSTLISSGQINSAYSTVVKGILAQAQALYVLGLPQQGTDVLNTITPSYFPAPPSTTMSTALLVGVVVAALIVIVLAVLLVRGRGKRGFTSGVVSEVQKELAILEVTAAKYDKSLADRLQALRNKLGETD